MNEAQLPATLGGAIGTEPMWLQAWVMVMVLVHLAAIFFLVGREQQRWRIRIEPIAIIASFLIAAVIMSWMYDRIGYVRLLGLAHLIAWTPVYVWLFLRRKRFPLASVYGKYIHLYLIVAGIALVIDAVDVIRHLAGDGELFMRWQ